METERKQKGKVINLSLTFVADAVLLSNHFLSDLKLLANMHI
jgi:hypothetical protein